MPEPVSIICPHCDSKLKLKDRDKLGQKIACPKCKKHFKATEKVDDEEEFAALDDMDEEFEEEESPRRSKSKSTGKSTGSAKGKRKGKSRGKSSGQNLPLIIGGVALLLVVGIGLTIWSFMGPGDQPVAPVAAAPVPAVVAPPVAAVAPAPAMKSIDFSWLPSQSEAVVYFRPSEILKSPFSQWLIDATGGRDQLNQGMEQMRQELGITADDIESITIGSKNIRDLAAGATGIDPGQMPDPIQVAMGLSELGKTELVGIARLSKPVDLTKSPQFQQLTEAVVYHSVSYYRDKSINGQPSSSFTYFPAPNQIVICGREDVMQGLIDRQGKAEPRAELDFIDPRQHFAVAFMMKPEFTDGLPDAPLGSTQPKAAFKKVPSGSISIKVTEGLEMTVTQFCPDATIAGEVQAATDAVVSEGQKAFRMFQPQMPKNLGLISESIVSSMKTSRSDRMVHLVASLPATTRESLKAAPSEVFMAMMMGGGNSQMKPGSLDPPSFKITENPGLTAPGFSDLNSVSPFRGPPVIVDKLEGLPEGLTLRGVGGWTKDPTFRQEGTPLPPRLLTFDIEYVGELKDKIVELGNVQIKKVAVEPPHYLKLTEAPVSFGGAVNGDGPFKNLIDLKDLGSALDQPFDCVQMRLYFEHPPVPPKQFTMIEGNVTLKVSEETKEIVVKDVFKLAGKPVADAELKSAGFAISSKTEGGKYKSDITFDRSAKVQDLKLIGANGQELGNTPFLMRMDMGGIPTYKVIEDGQPAPGIGAKVTLHTKFREVIVPFRFENVTVAESIDQLYVPGIPWTPSTNKNTPPGLVVDGHLRWEAGFSFNDQPAPPKLVLDIDVTGPELRHVPGAGFLKLTKAQTNSAGPLKLEDEYKSTTFQVASRSFEIQHSPPDGITVRFEFAPVQKAFTGLDAAAGSFKILVAEDRKTTLIEKVSSQLGKPVSNPDLKAAGLEFKFGVKEENLEFELTKGNGFAINQTRLVRESSADDEFGFHNYDANSKAGSNSIGKVKLKPNDAVEIIYYTGLKEVTVPFAFERLLAPPPPPPKK